MRASAEHAHLRLGTAGTSRGPETPQLPVQELPAELRREAAEVAVWNGGVVWPGLVKSSARLPEQRGRRSPGRGGLKTTSESSVWSFACREQTPRGAGLTQETGCGRRAGPVARDGAAWAPGP